MIRRVEFTNVNVSKDITQKGFTNETIKKCNFYMFTISVSKHSKPNGSYPDLRPIKPARASF